MKKFSCLLFALVMVLCLCAPAAAEAPVQHITVADNPFAPLNVTGLTPAADGILTAEKAPEDPFAQFKADIVAQIPTAYEERFSQYFNINNELVELTCGVVSAKNTSGYIIPEEYIFPIALNIVYDYPEVTWNVKTSIGWSSPQDPEGWMPGEMITLYLFFLDGADKTAFDAAVDAAAAACFCDGMTDFEKALSAHEWLATHVFYDPFVANSDQDYTTTGGATFSRDEAVYTPYGAFANGKAVCQGYALSYKLLLDRAGVNCCVVTSDAMNHAWNMVQLDGVWYQVDVTWDDPIWDIGDMAGYAQKNYFLRSDADFYQELEHYGWTTEFNCACPDNYALPEALNRDLFVPVFLYDGTFCLINGWEGTLTRYSAGSDFTDVAASRDCPLYTSCAALWENTLYLRVLTWDSNQKASWNDPRVYAVPLNSAEPYSVAYTASDGSRGISAVPYPGEPSLGLLCTWNDYDLKDCWILGEAHTDENMDAVLYYPKGMQTIEDLADSSLRLETDAENVTVFVACYKDGRMTGIAPMEQDALGNLVLPENLSTGDADTVKMMVVTPDMRVLASPLVFH